uniref:Uncharacterized protein n=1 Tax=Virus NIOZ-UU157 TaxID=2763269 RepID=A0A7S9STU9_9VIRU|nr:MAG: hypothetical protein NIOZUU157_00225 [Virus NIOZ-UU157]
MNRSSNPVKHYAQAVYDFTVDGGAATTITPAETSIIPDNAIITDVCIEQLLVAAGNAHTLVVNAGGVAITAATSIANRSVTVPYTTVLPKKATAASAITVTLSAIATQGKSVITVGYFMSGE